MSSKRKQLRYTVKTLLMGNTSCGENVFANRPTPLWATEIPAIHVYVKSEQSEKITCAPKILRRSVRLVTEIVVNATENCDDIMDDIAVEIEDILFSNGYIRDPDEQVDRIDDEIELESTEINLVADGEKICGSTQITWVAPYHYEPVYIQDPDDLNEFRTANNKFDVNNDGVAEQDNTATIREEE